MSPRAPVSSFSSVISFAVTNKFSEEKFGSQSEIENATAFAHSDFHNFDKIAATVTYYVGN